MNKISRRRWLLALGALPIASMVPGPLAASRPVMTVAQAMHYLTTEVFPSPNEKRHRFGRWPSERSRA
ncbi:hypothetical protein [Cupriavidus agavae]|uniref:hypothetical protein n=1 Tax=Cupriavidus agavae TaxID=1001822 RepID=UPI00102AF51F|nr:hypothetical protein [Cupriavidus agavae]